jgi:hypothetical protein
MHLEISPADREVCTRAELIPQAYREAPPGKGRHWPAIPRLFGGCPFRRADFRLAWPLMEAPRRYSVSPWYSFVTVTPTQHVPSFAETVRQIVAWLRGVKPTRRERQIEAAQIKRLVEELGDEEPETETSSVRRNDSETRSGETRSVSSHRRDESHGLPG